MVDIVAPRAGAWIETYLYGYPADTAQSLPARERGLKLKKIERSGKMKSVAPRAGAWIETCIPYPHKDTPHVAPRAGAWIETELLPHH